MVGRDAKPAKETIMSEFNKAELKLAKEVAQDGLQITHDPLHGNLIDQFLDHDVHTISGDLNGTQFLNLQHHSDSGAHLLGHDTLDFTILGGHNFNMTIQDFNPAVWNSDPTDGQLHGDAVFNWHDLLQLTYDPSSGVTSSAQLDDVELLQRVGHDFVLSINAADVRGTITFLGLADKIPGTDAAHFSWIDHFPVHVV
jgi:hypothetical protein